MREIKFRAWDSLTNSWLDVEEQIGFESNGDGASYLILVDNGGRLAWEQYTGLKDKNGREIYEGDILKGHDRKGKACLRCGHVETSCEIGSVIWSDYDYDSDRPNNYGQWNIEHDGTDYQLSDSWEYKVIGNIHENPELL